MVNIVKFNLQLFGEKTEKATSKKKKDARKKGQVAMSKDFSSALGLLVAFVVINALAGYSVNNIRLFYMEIFSIIEMGDGAFTPNSLNNIYIDTVSTLLKIAMPILGAVLLTGVLTSVAQVGFMFTTETLVPKFDKINPINGFKKLFSLKSAVELVKSLMKGSLVFVIVWNYLSKNQEMIVNLISLDVEKSIIIIWNTVFDLTIRICTLLLILAIVDFVYKNWEHEKDLRMSKQEIKEEYKMMEGDPLLKSKIKEKQRQMAASRMMQEVPKADVIITNPTHFAVALRYDSSLDSAPKVIAKGQDLVAHKIKAIALENDIPVVENKPLARAIFGEVNIGDVIPGDLFEAVAEVLAYVYGLKK